MIFAAYLSNDASFWLLSLTIFPYFAARFTCERVNAEAACIPIAPMYVTFTAPVSAKAAKSVLLTAKDGTQRRPADLDTTDDDDTVYSIRFEGPFPELS